jgi:hypothetical protein
MHRYEREHPGLTISDHELFKCICPCIKREKIADCVCPICVDMQCELRALRDAIGCGVCRSGQWGDVLSSPSSFASVVSCPDEIIPEMMRADSSDDFFIRPLRCCVSESSIPNLSPCSSCHVRDRLQNAECPCFSSARLGSEVIWLKRQDTIEGKNHDKVVSRLRSYKGKLSELLQSVKEKAKPYLYHLWRVRFMRRQFHLDSDYFDPSTECLLLGDFASAMVRTFSLT